MSSTEKTTGARGSSPQRSSLPRRALIVEDDTLVGLGLKDQLVALGHEVVGQASTAPEATAMFQDRQPDLVLMDIRLDGVDGIELAAALQAKRRVPMIIVSAFSEKALVARAGGAGVFGYLIKPVSGESLAAQIEVAGRRFQEKEELIKKNEELSQTLENRKFVEKAKGIFMRRLSLTEADAHRHLQQECQKRRISIGELAKLVIESEQLLGG